MPSIQATSLALLGPRTNRRVMNSAKARAAPVRDQTPISPPRSQRYSSSIPAALVVASDGISTSPVMSYWPSSSAPAAMPAASEVMGSRVTQQSSTATMAGSSEK